ncbi:cation:proton antiporter [Wenxinia saemankumensis]|uniref:Multisubunit potassium/proton antiporter, PhaG subunit n=1 Tax=Wenxinia saemankumensis TaxID=1447782 RepID=A0A1M6AFE2_9RHOB|nr:monovalent cation/H(+) antiporter subunit G [Wenxinia saemankumensis]SHI35185.1 multisubunit potassium/proton antiporter, PhaG subunit [Wenxinia saemankumensis]
MTLADLAMLLTALFLLIGSAFVLIGVAGLLKFDGPMTRLHAPTKVGTIGIGMLLLASMTNAAALGEPSFHEVLIMAFLFVTAPVSANFIAKVNIHRRDCDPPPKPPGARGWATLKPTEDAAGAGDRPAGQDDPDAVAR